MDVINCRECGKKFSKTGNLRAHVKTKHYTQQESNKLGLKGWCMNTEHGTVQGLLQGEADKINEMKMWLQYTGSPASKIEKAVFKNEKEIKSLSFTDFKVRR